MTNVTASGFEFGLRSWSCFSHYPFVIKACHALCLVHDGSTNGAQTSQPRATPWGLNRRKTPALKGRQSLCRPFRAGRIFLPGTQGVALGWLVSGPLALQAADRLNAHDRLKPLISWFRGNR